MAEAWLRGAIREVQGIEPVLVPAAYMVVQAGEEIAAAAAGLSVRELWLRPGGAAPVGYHLRHLAGSTDRLLTYAAAGSLSDAQLAALAAEGEPPRDRESAESLVEAARTQLDRAIDAMRAADPGALHSPRSVGRAALPSTVFGLLCHIGEHSARHAGQVITTAKIARALAAGGGGASVR